MLQAPCAEGLYLGWEETAIIDRKLRTKISKDDGRLNALHTQNFELLINAGLAQLPRRGCASSRLDQKLEI